MPNPPEIILAASGDTSALQRLDDFTHCPHAVAIFEHAHGKAIDQQRLAARGAGFSENDDMA